MAEPVVIGYGQNKWIKDADTKMVYLASDASINNSGMSMKHAAAGSGLSTYTVPAGKVYILLLINIAVYSTTAKEGFQLFAGVGLASTHNKITYALNNSTTENEMIPMETYVTFEAGENVNMYWTGGSGSMRCSMLGVETNA